MDSDDDMARETMAREIDALRERGADALAELFSQYRDKLERMVHFRLDKRLYGRVDTVDVLQEAYMKAAQQIDNYLVNASAPVHVWLRQITAETLADTYRRHIGAQRRDVSREIGARRGGLPHATSFSIAAQLIGNITSPSRAAMRDELLNELRTALEGMDEIDREVLALRHFEELSNNEVAEILGLQKSAASNRYIRALSRLKDVLAKSNLMN